MGTDRDAGAGRGPRQVTRRAVRTTAAACAGFFVCLYGLDRPVAATYALFTAVSMAALSHVPGTGPQRARVLVRAAPVAGVLVVAGTFLAVRTWTAVAGMLAVGFLLAFAAVAGPRAAGAAPGLQLLYILPSFPPYAPGTLGERLAGAAFGLVLLILAEAFLLPEPRGTPYRELAAAAAATAARCATELEAAPYTLSAGSVAAARAAGQSVRPSLVDPAERPAGPGLRDRALAHAGLATRTLLGRLTDLPPPPPGRAPTGQRTEVLGAVAAAAAETAQVLTGGTPGPGAAEGLRRVREEVVASDAARTGAARGRRRAALLELADAAAALCTAADLAVRGRHARPPAETEPGRFWYAGQRAPRLWWHRLAAHAGPRSVYFQNAVRLGLALGAARTVAGVESLPHGFWAMLAVLSLTRTTAAQTGATVRKALTGTLVGALLTAGVLFLVGGHTTVYAVALPVVMLVAFRVGPVRGVGWAQGMFTLVVAFVFAQLAPVSWRLAEVRIMDVALGSLLGVVFGLLAWPRGAQQELHRAVAVLLTRAAETVVGTAAAVAAGAPGRIPQDQELQLALSLSESAFAEHQSEPPGRAVGGADWQAAMITGHHVLWGSRRLLGRGGPAPEPSQGERLRARAEDVAGRLRATAGAAAVRALRAAPAGGPPQVPVVPGVPAADPDETAPARYFAALAWLDALDADLVRMTAPAAGPVPQEAAGGP
ncbi:FUSC family protein [Streptomyces sp. NPDC089919]|uniref:FUSC family protein n=1 Tax=Streptomyces sp. NPDC089919 TaxID=3155188 RepID=UPI0034372B82